MIGLLNYNFLSDGNASDPMPTNVESITSIKLQNGIYDGLYVTKDVVSTVSTTIPTQWDFNTILLANFNGNLSAGNIEQTIETLRYIRIKKRLKGTFDWITIKEYQVSSVGDLSFSFSDNLSKNNTEYEYAWIPVLEGGTEGGYTITEVLSKFNGVFVADADSIYKFAANVAYGQTQRVQQVGTFEPYGRKYPVYVSNGMINYEQGSMNALLVGEYFNEENKEKYHQFIREDMVNEKDSLFNFLTNKRAKIIKDYNGNYWLVIITGNPTVEYDNNWGNGMMTANFQWSEVGDANNANDMKSAGLSL